MDPLATGDLAAISSSNSASNGRAKEARRKVGQLLSKDKARQDPKDSVLLPFSRRNRKVQNVAIVSCRHSIPSSTKHLRHPRIRFVDPSMYIKS